MTVDLQKQAVTAPSGAKTRFEIDAERRQALLEGRDEIGMTLVRDADIRAFQDRDRVSRPWIYQKPHRRTSRRRLAKCRSPPSAVATMPSSIIVQARQ